MQTSQQVNKEKFFQRALFRQRVTSGAVFLVVAALFGLLWLMAYEKINMGWLLSPCGFKQRYGLPCPTCGMTTSALAFVQGKIFESFYIQPAAALLCCVLVVTAFLALFTAVSGVYLRFVKHFITEVKIRYVILALIVIVAAGWAVTLARALRV